MAEVSKFPSTLVALALVLVVVVVMMLYSTLSLDVCLTSSPGARLRMIGQPKTRVSTLTDGTANFEILQI